jgi:hypothetical protein
VGIAVTARQRSNSLELYSRFPDDSAHLVDVGFDENCKVVDRR